MRSQSGPGQRSKRETWASPGTCQVWRLRQERRVLTAATAACSCHVAPHPFVGRPPLHSWRGRCSRTPEGLRQDARTRTGRRGHWAKVRRGPEGQRGRAGGGDRGARTIGSCPVVLGRREGRSPGRRGRGCRLHVRVTREVGVLRGRGRRARGRVGRRAQAEAGGPGGAWVHGGVLVQHIAHVHGDRRVPRACWALEPPRRPAAPTTSDCSPGPAAAAAPAPPRPFIAAGRPRPQPGGFAFQSGGKPRGRESKGEARRARGFKRRQIAALSGRWMGQRAGDPEGAAWVMVQAQLRVPTLPSVVAGISPPPTRLTGGETVSRGREGVVARP